MEMTKENIKEEYMKALEIFQDKPVNYEDLMSRLINSFEVKTPDEFSILSERVQQVSSEIHYEKIGGKSG